MNRFKSSSGFTLIEILVVLSIIAAAATLSTFALSSFRGTAAINDSTQRILGYLRSVQSSAIAGKNIPNPSGHPNWAPPFSYEVLLSSNGFKSKGCQVDDSQTGVSNTSCNDISVPEILDMEGVMLDTAGARSCSSIKFFTTNTNIVLRDQVSVATSCCIFLKNVQSNERRYIYVNSLTREISTVSEEFKDANCK